MKRILPNVLTASVALILACCAYDDTELRSLVDGYESRINDLELRLQVVEKSSRDLSAYQSLLEKLDGGKTVTGYSESDGEISLTFSDNSSVTFNQKGVQGDRGPQGEPGNSGQDGITPLFRINENTCCWEVSYDEGATWKDAGSAMDRSLVSDVVIGKDGDSVTLYLADGTSIMIPCGETAFPGSGLAIPYILRDDMVLQRNTDANIWGWAADGSVIQVSVSWSSAHYRTSVDSDGLWKVAVATPDATFSPQWIKITCGKQSITLENILIGEVWLCSGQSNMDMRMTGWDGQPVENSAEAMRDAYLYPEVRMYIVPQVTSITKQEQSVGGAWWSADGGHIAEFSATAYFFGRDLARKLSVPIGLVVPCWSGSMIEPWMDREALYSVGWTSDAIDQNISRYMAGSAPQPHLAHTVMYNSMIYPIRHYTINGFIWYQGCSNVYRVSEQDYAEYQAAMVTRWRKLFGRGNLPFYYVQIAPYNYGGNTDTGIAPILRDRQKAAAKLVPNSAMIATCDLVSEAERGIIHPRKKAEVGERLANLALEHWYNLPGYHSDSPDLLSVTLQGSSARIFMTNCTDGLHCKEGTELSATAGFEVAGSNKVWYPAQITATGGNTVDITSSMVADIKYVRYLWHDFVIGYLWNSYGLPLLPFTTE